MVVEVLVDMGLDGLTIDINLLIDLYALIVSCSSCMSDGDNDS